MTDQPMFDLGGEPCSQAEESSAIVTEHAKAGKRSYDSRQARGAADPEAQRNQGEVQFLSAPLLVERCVCHSGSVCSPACDRGRHHDGCSQLLTVYWREVPAALFLSWSNEMQLAYCAARDEDSATHADTKIEAEWFRDRARSYKELLNASLA